jgi:predicted Zn-dependent protease with MMP-like domain
VTEHAAGGRRRDRRGRGLRGSLLPGDLPAARTRSEQFDELVLDAVSRVSQQWGSQLAAVDVLVEDVPPADADGVPLSRAEPATLDEPARIVVYRRPVESRARTQRVREDLVHDVVVEAVADLLGLPPEVVDPDREDGEPPG